MKNDNSDWKLFFIYHDPEDERVFVKDRLGKGWTLNFAQWQSYAILAVLITLIVLSMFFAHNR